MTDFYVYTTYNYGALDHSAIVFYLTEEVADWVKVPFNPTIATEVGEYLDELETRGILLYEHEFIPVEKTNRYGRKAFKGPIETMLPTLMLKAKVRPDNIYRNTKCPASIYFCMQRAAKDQQPNLYLGEWICWFKRKWWIDNYWHNKFPQYEWNKNGGAFCKEHALLVLDYGPVPELHHVDFLRTIPRYWLQELRGFNPKDLFGHDYNRLCPPWWKKIIKCNDFGGLLKPEEREELKTIALRTKPMQFEYYLTLHPPIQTE